MNWEELRLKALRATKIALSKSVNDDNLIIQTISSMEELDKHGNTLVKRLREWYELYCPEASKAIGDNEAFARVVVQKSKDELLKEAGAELTMGADLAQEDLDMILSLAKTVNAMFDEREQLNQYLETIMTRHCPNLAILAGASIGARLLREAGSLQKLASIQSSTIQLYGAEKALFRHIKTGARPPKHGYIINHPLVSSAHSKDKGKVARALADKISIACKVDYFKGEPIGQELRNALEKKFGDKQ